ncbi:MAG: tetratricopeptide repeat protein [Actinomycetales bacterium]|nr:tetratricopeptide repeat protein [Actinomycetales bacterium]
MSDDFDYSEMSDDELWEAIPAVSDFEKGQIYFHLHQQYSKKPDHQAALSVATQAEEIYLKLNSHREIGIAKMLQGRSHFKLKEYGTAIECLSESKDVLLTADLDGDRAHCFFLIGDAYFNLKGYENAAVNYLAAIELYEAFDEHCAVASISNDAGHAYFRQGNYPKSIKFFERSIKAAMDGELPHHMFHSYSDLAHVYQATGAYDAALECANRALALGMTCSCPNCEPKALALQGRMLRSAGDLAAARQTLNRAKEIFYGRNDTKAQIGVLVDLGLCYVPSNGRKAMEYFNQAETLLEMYPKMEYQLITMNLGMGILANIEGEFEYAKDFLNLAYDYSKSSARYTALRHEIIPHYFKALFALGLPKKVLKILAETERGPEPWLVDEVQIATWKAQAHLALGESEIAIEQANAAIEMAGHDDDYLLSRATCHKIVAEAGSHQDCREAREHAQKAISCFLAAGEIDQATELNAKFVRAPEKQLADALADEDDRNTYDELFGKTDPIAEQLNDLQGSSESKNSDDQADSA